MAKVKIQGHASGTGILTVTAPNTSTDRTITLPDATGTLLNSDGSAANLTAIPAANITGTLPAIDGSSLTGIAGRKNMIINGDFSVNQRATAATTGGTYLTADRFQAGATTVTFQTVANDRDLSIPNMLKVTSHTNGYGIIVQRVEDVHTASGKNVTLSFWAKTSDFSNLRLEIQQNFGSGGSGTVTVVNNATYFTVPDSNWNQYTATIALPSISGKTIGTSSLLNILFGANSGTSGGITYYSEVQLELGTAATDFEHRSYGEELALCQRYYQKRANDSSGATNVFWGNGQCDSSTILKGAVFFNPPMRVPPTAFETTGTASDYKIWFTGNTASTCTSVPTMSGMGTWGGRLVFEGGANLIAGQAGVFRAATADAYLAWSAEL